MCSEYRAVGTCMRGVSIVCYGPWLVHVVRRLVVVCPLGAVSHSSSTMVPKRHLVVVCHHCQLIVRCLVVIRRPAEITSRGVGVVIDLQACVLLQIVLTPSMGPSRY